MSEQENLDIGRVVGLIMENPQLIEQIAALAKHKGDEEKIAEAEEKAVENTAEAEPAPVVNASVQPEASDRANRTRLLSAFKPYVSKERAKAIDSMISIADILDLMRAR